jgi:hypothetical protein
MIDNKLKIITLSIWWGVFTFYACIVVPVGMDVLGSHTQMGFVTQEITKYLNIISLILFIIYAYTLRNDEFSEDVLIEQIISFSLIGFQLLLFVIHIFLTDLLDFKNHIVLNQEKFYVFHRVYLIIETLIWLVVSWRLFVLIKQK